MKIMIVDDSAFALQYIKKTVQERYPKAEIILESSGEAACNTFLSAQPDVVITDLLMPGIDGQRLINKIRQIDSKCMIIVISCDIQNQAKYEMEQLNVHCFLNKPLNDDNVIQLYKTLQALPA